MTITRSELLDRLVKDRDPEIRPAMKRIMARKMSDDSLAKIFSLTIVGKGRFG